jgi:hypothetical protein
LIAKKSNSYLGAVVIVVVVVIIIVAVFCADLVKLLRGDCLAGGCGLALLQGRQVELLALKLKGNVFDLPHGGTLCRCEKRHAHQSSGKNHSYNCSD